MKCSSKVLILLGLLLSFNAITAFGQVKITHIEPTPFFPKVEKGESLKQLAHIYVEAAKDMPVKVQISVAGEKYIEEAHFKQGIDTLDVHVMDVQFATPVKFEILDAKQKVIAEKEMTWQPQKKWKVYYAAVSHHDLGFITYYQNLRKANRESEIDTALVYCQNTDDWDENDQFRWNVESSEPLIRWMAKQTPETIKEFERRVQEGRIEIIANHNTISSQMPGYEMLARSFYTPNRYIVDRLDIEPSKITVINDVTGITRTWPLFLKEADIPYFMHGSNHPNNLYDMFDKPVFKWLSPDGDTENVPLCRTDSYYSPNKVKTWDLNGVSSLIERHVDLDWQFDCILAYDSHDFAIPAMKNANNIKAWNSKYEYPKFRCSVISTYFDDIASQLKPGMVEETSKDAPDSWNDQEIIDADLLARARKANSAIPATEKLASIAMTLAGGYPEAELFQAYNRIIMYHEHTNGAIDGGNHKYYETENVMHAALVDEAIDINEQALQVSLEKIGSQIKTKASALVVYNSLNWERNEMVYLEANKVPFEYFKIIDAETKKPVQLQKLKDGRLAFYAESIPSLGYKSYTIKKAKKAGYSTSEMNEASSLENDFYKIELDRTKNIIADVLDKELGKNIIDKSSPYALGEYIHYDHFSDEWKKTTFTDIKYFKGDVLDEIHISQDAYLTGKVELVVYVHHKTKKIDFALEVDKLSNGEELTGGWNRYMKEAAFCAVPVLVPDYQHHHELAGAVTQPGNKELQFEASESAFYAIQHFADASNDDFGVTLSTIETNCVNYGHPRPVYWNNDGRRPKEDIVKPENSNMFLFLMNNFFQTNVQVDQPGIKNYTFSIRSHNGDWQGGKAYQFAWETSNPIVSQFISKNKKGKLPAKQSFLTTDKDNVVLSTLKKAEANGDGLVLRFFEVSGKDSKVKVKLNFAQDIDKAYVLNLLEKDKEEIAVSNNEIEFDINGHGIKTLRLLSATSDNEITNLKAKALSNEEVQLTWEGNSSGFYNVYRSLSPEFELNALSHVGLSEGTTFVDKTVLDYAGGDHQRVEPNTSYYYKVQPVDRFNNRGVASEVVACTTLKTEEANAKPNKVAGVYTVHVSPLAPEDFINLWFYTNFEKDVDKYLIHRGESADFIPNEDNLIHTLIPSEDSINFHHKYSNTELNRQMFEDKTAKVNIAYYYKVAAVDNGGNIGEYSDSAYAYMEKVPVKITHEYIATDKFETFRPKAKITIECRESGYDMYYTTETRSSTSEEKKYSTPFEITEASVINVEVYKANTKDLAYRYRRFVNVNQNISQSDYNGHLNSLKATDGSYYSGWVSKKFGGQTKENPADVWLGVNLGKVAKVAGLKVIGDRGDVFPIHDQFRVYMRNGETLNEVAFKQTPDKDVRNTFHVKLDKPVSADGVMVFFDKDNLPVEGGIKAQEGYVRINEWLILDEKGESILRSNLLPIE